MAPSMIAATAASTIKYPHRPPRNTMAALMLRKTLPSRPYLASRSASSPSIRRVTFVSRSNDDNASASTSESNSTVFYGGRSFTDAEWQEAVKSGTVQVDLSSSPAPTPAPAVAGGPSITDVMAFNGAAPERINGRLAMLAFISAIAAEAASGQSVWKQLSEEPTGIVLASVVFIAASLIPMVSGADKGQNLGPFTPDAELINGRAAMCGFAALLVIEALKGSAFI